LTGTVPLSTISVTAAGQARSRKEWTRGGLHPARARGPELRIRDMTSLPAATASVQPRVRHGKARLYIGINATVYTLIRDSSTNAWHLTAQSGARQGSRYVTGITTAGQPACSCPDHLRAGNHCKHIGALVAAGLLPRTEVRQ